MNKANLIFKPAIYSVLLLSVPLAKGVLAMRNEVIAKVFPEDHYVENVSQKMLMLVL